MKSDVETLNPTRVKLTVAVPYAELKPSVDAAYKALAGQVQVPGFRRGKVPPRVIDQRFGRGAVIQEAVSEALPRFYQQALTETSLRPLGQPEVDVTDLPSGTGADAGELRFTAEVDVRPTLQLPDFSSIAVTVDAAVVTDDDVDEALQKLRVRFGTLTAVERPVEQGDVLTLDLKAAIDGETVDDAEGATYEVGSDSMLPGLDEAVLGRTAGETATFTAPLAAGEHQGKDAEITVTVGAVKVRELPEVDDEFAQLASEFDTIDDLRADLRVKAEQEKTFAQGVDARDKVMQVLLETVDIPVPDAVVEAEVTQHLENESRLEDDAHRAEVDVQTRAVLREQFLLDAIAEAEEVTVSQEEVIDYLVIQAPRYGMDPNSFAQAMGEAGQVPALVGEVARRKALAIVLGQVKVTDSEGAIVDLGDGMDDDDVDDQDDDAPVAADRGAAHEPQVAASEDVVVGEVAAPSPAASEAASDAPAKPKRVRAPKAAAVTAAASDPASGDASEPTPEVAPKRRRAPKAAEPAESVETA